MAIVLRNTICNKLSVICMHAEQGESTCILKTLMHSWECWLMLSAAQDESLVSGLAVALRLIMQSFHPGNDDCRFTSILPQVKSGPCGLCRKQRVKEGYVGEVGEVHKFYIFFLFFQKIKILNKVIFLKKDKNCMLSLVCKFQFYIYHTMIYIYDIFVT